MNPGLVKHLLGFLIPFSVYSTIMTLPLTFDSNMPPPLTIPHYHFLLAFRKMTKVCTRTRT